MLPSGSCGKMSPILYTIRSRNDGYYDLGSVSNVLDYRQILVSPRISHQLIMSILARNKTS
jgi:hypothetical protein